ncbi:hypothetical protein ECPA32_1277 [Escherichia coli PA32]|nr:hypothetical protein ECPA32_1277 [Escherichia coli PA32]
MPSIPKASKNASIAFWRCSCLRRLFHFFMNNSDSHRPLQNMM